MRHILANLRVVVAAQRAFESLGAVVEYYIKTVIIPKLDKLSESADPDDKIRIAELISKYQSDLNRRPSEYSQIAESIVSSRLRNIGLNEMEIAEVAQGMVELYFTGPRWIRDFEMFNVLDGPDKLKRFWNKNLHFRSSHYMSRERGKFLNKIRQQIISPEEMENVPRTITPAQIEDVIGNLREYVRNRIGRHDPLSVAILERWLDVAEEKGPEEVNFSRDVADPVLDEMASKGKVFSKVRLYQKWNALRGVILDFFEDEMGYEFSPAQRSRMVAARVAEWYSRRIAAAYILGRNY